MSETIITAMLGITTIDIAEALKNQSVEPSSENIAKVAMCLRNCARVAAQAWLQDEKDLAFWIADEKDSEIS